MNKGFKIEESLRNYFIGLGFYVIRGVKFNFKDILATDIDLFLYNRPSSLTRERINVDIKNKKNPQATERIFWTKGVQNILEFDNCIIATTDKRPQIKDFGDKHNVIVLDGNFLNKIKEKDYNSRLTEEEFIEIILKDGLRKVSDNWSEILESEKSNFLTCLDYSGAIETLENIKIFIESSITNVRRRESSCRILYLLISYFLIKIDFILKDLAFANDNARKDRLDLGLKYGNTGIEGLEKVISTANQIFNSEASGNIHAQIHSEYDKIPTNILSEYFSKFHIGKKMFTNAKLFEFLAYSRNFKSPNDIPLELKSILSLILDYFLINRKDFFKNFPTTDSDLFT